MLMYESSDDVENDEYWLKKSSPHIHPRDLIIKAWYCYKSSANSLYQDCEFESYRE